MNRTVRAFALVRGLMLLVLVILAWVLLRGTSLVAAETFSNQDCPSIYSHHEYSPNNSSRPGRDSISLRDNHHNAGPADALHERDP